MTEGFKQRVGRGVLSNFTSGTLGKHGKTIVRQPPIPEQAPVSQLTQGNEQQDGRARQGVDKQGLLQSSIQLV